MNWGSGIFIVVVAYAGIFLEASVEVFRHWLGAQISLLPALMVYTSLTRGIGAVTALAICGGLGVDSLSANPPGVSILPLFVIGFVILRQRGLLLRESRFAQMALGLAAGAWFPLGTLFLLLNLGVAPLLGWRALWQWVVGTLAGGVLTPGCFALFDWWNAALTHPARAQTSFRADREIKRRRQ